MKGFSSLLVLLKVYVVHHWRGVTISTGVVRDAHADCSPAGIHFDDGRDRVFRGLTHDRLSANSEGVARAARGQVEGGRRMAHRRGTRLVERWREPSGVESQFRSAVAERISGSRRNDHRKKRKGPVQA